MDVLVELNLPSYEKCGEIMSSYNEDKRLYALKCLFCEKRFHIFDTLDFINHIEETHILPTKEEKDILRSDELITTICIEPKEEHFEDDPKEESLDPLTYADLNEFGGENEEDDLSPNENKVKTETEYECSDFDYEAADHSGASVDSNTENDSEPSNNFLFADLRTNKDLTLELIEGYRKLPVLWEKSHSQHQIRQKREEALRNLAKDLNRQFGKRMKWTGIDDRIKILRKLFRTELIKEKTAATKGEIYHPTWYFSKLDFLRSAIKSRNSKRKISLVKKSAIVTEIPFDDEQHTQFIKIYESFPCLWNMEDVSYKSKSQREIAMAQMMLMIEEKMKLKLTEDEIQRKIHRLRSACTKEKHEILKSERLGTTHQPTFKYFSSISFLVDHVCPFKCPFCLKTFKGREVFRVHKAQHDGSSPFTCSICKKSYSSAGNLAIHLRRHNRDYTYECKPCARKFATTDEYNIHMRQHTGEKPYFCEVCGKSFATCSLFGRHKRRHEKRPTHFCTICNRGFYEQIRYKEHMNIHNNVRDRVCDVCGKGFTHLKYLKQHKLIHTGRRDYICTICGKDFAQSAGLYWHMKTHGAKVSEKVQTEDKAIKKEITKQKKEALPNELDKF